MVMNVHDQNGAEQVIVFVPTDILLIKAQGLQRHDTVVSSSIFNNSEFVEGYAEADT